MLEEVRCSPFFLFTVVKKLAATLIYIEGGSMTQKHFSLKEVADIVGVRPHRISYAVSNGFLTEPIERITNRRMFTASDVEAAKKYFTGKDAKKRQKGIEQ